METMPSLPQSFYPRPPFQHVWVVSSPFRGSAHAVLREHIMSELVRLSAHSGCMWQKINSVQFNQKGYRAGKPEGRTGHRRKFQAFSKITRGSPQAILSPWFLQAPLISAAGKASPGGDNNVLWQSTHSIFPVVLQCHIHKHPSSESVTISRGSLSSWITHCPQGWGSVGL